MNLQDMIEMSKVFDEEKYDLEEPMNKLHFDGGLIAQGAQWTTIEDNAINQLAEKMKMPPAWVTGKFNNGHTDEVYRMMNYWKNYSRSEVLIRTHGTHVRAVLSEDYRIFGVTDLLEIANEVIGDDPQMKFLRPIVTRDELSLRIELMNLKVEAREERNKWWSTGVLLRNGEIGLTGIHIKPFAKRTACDNSTVFQGGLSMAHNEKRSLAWIRGSASEFIGQGLRVAEKQLQQVVSAEMAAIPDWKKVRAELERKYLRSNELVDEFSRGTEYLNSSSLNLMHIINGLTHAAKSMDTDEGIRVESVAGSLLSNADKILAHPESLFGIIAKQAVTA